MFKVCQLCQGIFRGSTEFCTYCTKHALKCLYCGNLVEGSYKYKICGDCSKKYPNFCPICLEEKTDKTRIKGRFVCKPCKAARDKKKYGIKKREHNRKLRGLEAAVFREIMDELIWSVKDCAKVLGLYPWTIHKYRFGKCRIPADVMSKIRHARLYLKKP